MLRPRTLPARITALLLLALVLGACGGNDTGAEEHDGAPPRVRTQPVTEVLQPRPGTAPATVRAPNRSDLSTDVSARVARVVVDVGGTVAAGELLLALDDTDFRLALAQAQARVGSAQARVGLAEQRLERAQRLREQRFVSEDEVLALATEAEAAQAELRIARADRDVAARNVEKCRITAPFDGVVVERMAQVGTLAAAGTPLLRLVDLAPVELEADLQSADAGRLDQAQDLRFHSQGRSWPVELLRLAPVIEAGARTRVARLGFTDAAPEAGRTGELRWMLPARELPPRLMVRRGNALGVFIAEDGIARFIAAPGAQEGRPFAVELPADARVVTEGQQGLQDGDRIEAVDDGRGTGPDAGPTPERVGPGVA